MAGHIRIGVQYHRNYITAEETKRKQEARYLIFPLLICRCITL